MIGDDEHVRVARCRRSSSTSTGKLLPARANVAAVGRQGMAGRMGFSVLKGWNQPPPRNRVDFGKPASLLGARVHNADGTG